jgi:hypothetical protein
MLDTLEDFTPGDPIGAKFIGHNHSEQVAQTLQQLAKEARGRFRVAAALYQNVEHIPVLINRSPEVVQLASNADEYLIQKPFVSRSWPTTLEAIGVRSPKTQAPLADGLIADQDASRCQYQLDFAQAQAEAVIQPDTLVDDFSRISGSRSTDWTSCSCPRRCRRP